MWASSSALAIVFFATPATCIPRRFRSSARAPSFFSAISRSNAAFLSAPPESATSQVSGAGNFRQGSTPYDSINVALKFADGIATAEDIRVESPTSRLTLKGTASVPAREYDLKGVASLISTSNSGPGFELPFVVQGPWDDPLIFPDPESLIRRSPATEPLLDAVERGKAL